MFSSIVCAIDFSDQSLRASRLAAALAARSGGRLTLLHATDPLLAEAAATRYGAGVLDAEVARDLDAAAAELRAETGSWAPEIRTRTSVGEAAEEIVKRAAQERADLVVLGTHGLSGYRKVFVGSVAERVLRRSPVPVLVVPEPEGELVAFGETGPEFAFQRVLAPLDFAERSTADARVARDVAAMLDLPLLLLHVVTRVHAPDRWRESLGAREQMLLAEAGERLDRIAAEIGGGQPPQTLVSIGSPADEIAASSSWHHAGLIVMGIRGTPGLLGARPGSIAYRVLCLVRTPVLALPG